MTSDVKSSFHKTSLFSRVRRGKRRGVALYPHRCQDGSYVASKSRFKRDYVHIAREELLDYVRRGYSLRMSNPDEGIMAPSLICSETIVIGAPA